MLTTNLGAMTFGLNSGSSNILNEWHHYLGHPENDLAPLNESNF